MRRLRRVVIAVLAGAVSVTGLVSRPAQAADPDVYTTPGGHIVAGRLWSTTCQMYSSDVVRCTSRIWATQVVYSGGSYRSVTGWAFNNLTYLPSPRARWATNPLGRTGEWTDSSGRRWRTECDTPATGRGGCRTFVEISYGALRGGRYVTQRGFVFNNLVRFAEGAVPHVRTIPAHVLDISRLTHTGLGPLQAGGSRADWFRLGYMVSEPLCGGYLSGPVLTSRGISVDGLADVAVSSPAILTVAGAKVGMSIAQIQAIYGSAFRIVPKINHGETQYFGSVRSGNRELQFRVLGGPDGYGGHVYAPSVPLVGGDVVAEISAQAYTTDVSFGGC